MGVIPFILIISLLNQFSMTFYWVASMAIPVKKWVIFGRFLFFLFLFFFLFFFVSVKVLSVTPLLSGVFVDRAFCAYFLRMERVVEMRRFLWWTQ